MCEELSANYDDLEKKCEEKVQRKSLEYNICNAKFVNLDELRTHRKTHDLRKGPFECEHCVKTFTEEWKMKAHFKTHQIYSM